MKLIDIKEHLSQTGCVVSHVTKKVNNEVFDFIVVTNNDRILFELSSLPEDTERAMFELMLRYGTDRLIDK